MKELEQDVKAECEDKYGKVRDSIVLSLLNSNRLEVLHIHVEEQSKGEIYVKF